MKFLLIGLLSVLAVSCADFKSESYGPGAITDADKFEKMSGDKFSHEDSSKQLFLEVTSSNNIVKIDIYKVDANGSPINVETTTYTCSTACITEVASDKTYKAVTTNSNSNEVVITTVNKVTNQSLKTEKFILVR